MEIIIYVIIAIVALGIGFAVAMAFQRNMARTRAKVIVEEAKNEAEVIKKDKLLEAREQGMRIEAEAEKQAQQKLAKTGGANPSRRADGRNRSPRQRA